MIEIIREESSRNEGTKELPKDIRQMGTPDIGMRIYVEQRVYDKLHAARRDHDKMVYVLLGRCENYAGKSCTFAESVIALEKTAFVNNVPRWCDDTWAYLYRHLTREHESKVIIGWAIDIRGMMPRLTAQLEKMHMDHFGGAHQVLWLMDTLEGEEIFYSIKNGRLCRREGFYIYNEVVKTINIGSYTSDRQSASRNAGARDSVQGGKQGRGRRGNITYDGSKAEAVSARGGSSGRLGAVRRWVSSFAMLAAVAVLGSTVYSNQQKMKELEAALMQVAEREAESEKIAIETVSGNVEMIAETVEETATEENAGATDAPDAEAGGVYNETLPENEGYISQGYYVVQEGDNLAGICRKIYQTTDIMGTICELNGIENENSIYVGQRLTLPN